MRCKGGQLEIEGIMVAEGRENSLDDDAMNSISDLATGTDFIVVLCWRKTLRSYDYCHCWKLVVRSGLVKT